ncbi:hypothetical protein COL154_004107 [Colletotrichum chrysophilum]|nr:hypothetical protein COL154_004107 [Colletotrichum chrysophilum]
MPIHDVLIIGGGPGGLAVATGLARQLYTAVVFDSGVYRNARTSHMHNVPTWDHRNPADFRSKARSDLLARYETITFEETNVESLRRNSEGRFEAKDARGATWTGKKIVLASGMRDVYPEIQGYDDVWGRGVNSASAGVLAVEDVAKAPVALHLARMAKRLARKVTIYTNGASELKDQIVTSLGKDPIIELDDRRVIRLEKVREEQLQLELTEAGAIKTSQPFYETTVQGVFAVGDCASTMPAVVNALAMGAFAAGGLVAQLGAEPTP